MTANYVLLDRIELNQTASSVTFSNIPQTGYTDLKLVTSTRTNAGNNWGYITLNGSSSNFTAKNVFGNGSSTYSQNRADNILSGFYNQGTATANTFSNAELYFPNYTSSNYKSISIDFVTENNATNDAIAGMQAQLWSSTAAITSITFTPYDSLVAGSTFSLYGIAQVGTTPAIAPKADGGNVIATDGTYWYHAFLSNGTFTPQVALNADVLVVAGGGGGGWNLGGGGGAGGLQAFTSQSLSATSYTCTVGSGGAGGTSSAVNGVNGINSQFASLTASVGGGGGGGYTGTGQTGGSGGGIRSSNGTPGSGTSGQGNAGGAGGGGNAGSGGGGATAAGGTAGTSNGGNGGAGSSAYSAWGLATTTGQNVSGTVYYAGGGGGSSTNGSGNGGTGGNGGGGTGYSASTSVNGTDGLVNTGGGGGGTQANGGSGIIIVRYAV